MDLGVQKYVSDAVAQTGIQTKMVSNSMWKEYGDVFIIVMGVVVFCLLILLISLIFNLTGLANFFGWIGIILAVLDIIFGFVLTFLE